MMGRVIFLPLLIVAFTAGSAKAQGFNCAKAADAVDRAICDTPELAKLDSRLDVTWQNFRANHPDLVPQAQKDGVVWYKARKMCAQRDDMVDCIREAESARIGQLDAAIASDTTSASPRVDDTSLKEHIWFGARIGQSAYVVAKKGIGTTAASLQILLDWNREVRACSDEFLTYTGTEPDQERYESCVKGAKTEFKSARLATASANCKTGEIRSFFNAMSRFYAGQIKHVTPADARSGTKTASYFSHIFHFEGFEVGDYGYTNVAVDGDVFHALCPNSFTMPPKVRLPELELLVNCMEVLAQAKRLATTSERLRAAGSRIANVLNVKDQGTSWFEAKCSASVILNNGEKATLEYRQIPRAAKYDIEAKVVK